MRMRCVVMVVAACAWLACVARAQEAARPADAPVVLENGLRVVLLPNVRARTVAMVTLYDIGEWHDPVGQSGLSHMTEHMIATAGAGEGFPARSAEAWMRAYPPPLGTNAQTGEDYTVMATVFMPLNLEREIAEGAARMSAIEVTEADMAREAPRLKHELENMYGGLAGLGAMNTVRGLIRPMAPGQRKGGVIEHVDGLTAADVQGWFDRYYKPRHAWLILAGAFDRGEALDLIRSHYGGIEAGEALPEMPERGQAQPGLTLQAAMESAFPGSSPPFVYAVGYAAPSPGDEDYAAFLVMVAELFQKSLKDFGQGRAGMSPPVMYAPMDDPGVVFLNGGGATIDEAKTSMVEARERAREAVPEEGAMVNAAGALRMFGPMLGLVALPPDQAAGNPYFVAFSHGRRLQMGLDAEALREALKALKPADLERCFNRWLSPVKGGAIMVETVE